MRDRYDDDRYRREQYRDDRGRDRDTRDFTDRARDEVRSWFGDEEAERRRRMLDGDRDWDDVAARNWSDREWRSRNWRSEGWSDRNRRDWNADRPWSEQNDYGYASGYRPTWRAGEYNRDWRSGDMGREQGWRGDYLSSYGSHDAPSRVGGYAGRGPKGYRRADTRIHEDVCDRLADAPDVDANDITVTVTSGEVTLSGQVRDRWQKHRAEDLVEEISGVTDVHNQLRVNREGVTETTATTAATPATTTTTRR